MAPGDGDAGQDVFVPYAAEGDGVLALPPPAELPPLSAEPAPPTRTALAPSAPAALPPAVDPTPLAAASATAPPPSAAEDSATAAESAPPPATTTGEVVMSFSAPCWVDVRDSERGFKLFGEMPKGARRVLGGTPPYKMVIGNSRAVTITIDGEPYDLMRHAKGNVARFTLNP
jgi:cytoskeleton protein RodZ